MVPWQEGTPIAPSGHSGIALVQALVQTMQCPLDAWASLSHMGAIRLYQGKSSFGGYHTAIMLTIISDYLLLFDDRSSVLLLGAIVLVIV